MTVDFAGTAPQVDEFLNVPIGSTYSSAYSSIKMALTAGGETIPANDGCYRPIVRCSLWFYPESETACAPCARECAAPTGCSIHSDGAAEGVARPGPGPRLPRQHDRRRARSSGGRDLASSSRTSAAAGAAIRLATERTCWMRRSRTASSRRSKRSNWIIPSDAEALRTAAGHRRRRAHRGGLGSLREYRGDGGWRRFLRLLGPPRFVAPPARLAGEPGSRGAFSDPAQQRGDHSPSKTRFAASKGTMSCGSWSAVGVASGAGRERPVEEVLDDLKNGKIRRPSPRNTTRRSRSSEARRAAVLQATQGGDNGGARRYRRRWNLHRRVMVAQTARYESQRRLPTAEPVVRRGGGGCEA